MFSGTLRPARGGLEDTLCEHGTGLEAEVAEHFPEVVLDGTLADEQLGGGLLIRRPLGDDL